MYTSTRHWNNVVCLLGYIQNSSIFRTWSIFRTLAIQKPSIFKILAYSEHIQNARHICNSVTFRILAYSELEAYSGPWLFRTLIIQNQSYIQSPGFFKTLAYSELKLYLETCYIKNPRTFRTWGIFRTQVIQNQKNIQNHDIFRTLVIQKPGIFKTLVMQNQRHIHNPEIHS